MCFEHLLHFVFDVGFYFNGRLRAGDLYRLRGTEEGRYGIEQAQYQRQHDDYVFPQGITVHTTTILFLLKINDCAKVLACLVQTEDTFTAKQSEITHIK